MLGLVALGVPLGVTLGVRLLEPQLGEVLLEPPLGVVPLVVWSVTAEILSQYMSYFFMQLQKNFDLRLSNLHIWVIL